MSGKNRRWPCGGLLLAALVAGCAALSRGAWAEPKVFVWVEGETPAKSDFEVKTGGGKAGLVSGDKMLLNTLPNKASIQAQVPDGGWNLQYRLDAPEAGRYEVWVRVAFEGARAAFRWRLNDAEWQLVPSDKLSTNVMEMGNWFELGWLHLGDADLEAGPALLDLTYRKEDQGDRMLVGIDCVALTKGHFVPEGRLKPGERYDGDADRQAAAHVFEFPEPGPAAERRELKLNGTWQIARYDDPDMAKDRFEPVKAIPTPDEYPLRWMAMDVPSSLWNKAEMVFGHRLFYRTRINVPAGYKGRGFKLHFAGTNYLVSVFVNGKLAGTHRGVWIPWDLDVSGLLEPGSVNELVVGVKDHYYLLDNKNYKGQNINTYRNIPHGHNAKTIYWLGPIYPSTKGDGDGTESGIVNPVTLVAVGDAYTEDVFVKTSVEKKTLEAELTLRNTGGRDRTFQVVCEAVNDRSNEVEKRFATLEVTVPAGASATKTVTGSWADPKLWWPRPNPDLYRLRTTVSEGGRALDVHEQLFGFREVTVRGTGVYINGVRRNFWNWVAVAGRPYDGESWLQAFRGEYDRFTRFSKNRKTSNFLRTREERLEFYDRNGIAGRLCSMIDGMFITHVFGDRVKDQETGQWKLIPNDILWANCREHMAQMAKAYRNHPSVIMYQAENEFIYITGTLRYQTVFDQAQALMNEVVEAARAVDPTRPYTVGGGGDLGGRLEINSPHYPAGSLDWYPENAYTLERFSSRITDFGWAWKRDKPWMVGESAFASELRYGTYCLGDRAFKGRDYANRGKARYLRMLYGGYRWADAAGFFPWDNLSAYEDARKVFHPLYIVPRKQTSRLYAGRENRLLFKVMNDTLSREPIAFEWTYEAGGRRIAGEKLTLTIEPGFGEVRTLVINAPAASERLDGRLVLRSSQPGAEQYEDVRDLPVLPVVTSLRAGVPVAAFDRSGKVEPFLKQAGVRFEMLATLDQLKGRTGLLIVGPDTLAPADAFGSDLKAFAAQGGAAIVLEQEVPVSGRNLPVPLSATEHYYGYVHPQALGTPLFKDLGRDDLIDWAGDHPTCKRVFNKPSRGARSLAECGDELKHSALVEVPCGKGVIVLCQLRVGAKLGEDPAADVLLRNMVESYAGFTPAAGVAAIFAPDDRLLFDNIMATGAQCEQVGSVAAALEGGKYKVAVVKATPENLAALQGMKAKVNAFQDAGGWLMLCGLGRDGIDEFNALMGTQHMIRPFRLERVTLENPEYRLAATLGNRDVALISPTVIQHGRKWVSAHTFSSVLDGENVAPFAIVPKAPEDIYDYTPKLTDQDPYNLVNGMLSTDHWRYYYSYWIDEGGAAPLVFKLRRPETIKQVNIWSNYTYWAIEDMDIIFDGDEATKVSVTLPVSLDVNEIKLPAPRRVEKTITFQIRSWRQMNPARPDIRLVGIDNVQFLRADPPPKAVFIDSAGGLVAFPRGEGGVFLNQVKFMADEPNPDNVGSKRNLVGIILQNMGVGAGGSSVAVPGVNVRYRTTNLTNWCTAFMTDHDGVAGWFGQKGHDLRDFQVGERVLADVTYHVPDYSTAPVPNCIVLGGLRNSPRNVKEQEVRGIRIGGKSDLLYFLHGASIARPVTEGERAQMLDRRRPFYLPEVARYVINYADGQKAVVPVILEKHVQHWLQDKPQALPGAAVAATFPVPGADGKVGVLYSMEVANPRPDVVIDTIDFLPGMNAAGKKVNRGVPALLGITLGSLVEK